MLELDQIIEQSKARGFGTVIRVLHTAVILFDGWELDNRAWIVEMEDGSIAALTTAHSGLVRWTRDAAEQTLIESEKSAESIRQALAMWPAN